MQITNELILKESLLKLGYHMNTNSNNISKEINEKLIKLGNEGTFEEMIQFVDSLNKNDKTVLSQIIAETENNMKILSSLDTKDLDGIILKLNLTKKISDKQLIDIRKKSNIEKVIIIAKFKNEDIDKCINAVVSKNNLTVNQAQSTTPANSVQNTTTVKPTKRVLKKLKLNKPSKRKAVATTVKGIGLAVGSKIKYTIKELLHVHFNTFNAIATVATLTVLTVLFIPASFPYLVETGLTTGILLGGGFLVKKIIDLVKSGIKVWKNVSNTYTKNKSKLRKTATPVIEQQKLNKKTKATPVAQNQPVATPVAQNQPVATPVAQNQPVATPVEPTKVVAPVAQTKSNDKKKELTPNEIKSTINSLKEERNNIIKASQLLKSQGILNQDKEASINYIKGKHKKIDDFNLLKDVIEKIDIKLYIDDSYDDTKSSKQKTK